MASDNTDVTRSINTLIKVITVVAGIAVGIYFAGSEHAILGGLGGGIAGSIVFDLFVSSGKRRKTKEEQLDNSKK